MANFLLRNTRLLGTTIGMILVAGITSYSILPRIEDPPQTERIAVVHTLFPGAAAERVESLVTHKLEERILGIEEIKQVRSSSRAGISTLLIELRGEVLDPDPVWSRVRDRIDHAARQLPAEAFKPDFQPLDAKAFAVIIGLSWNVDHHLNHAILRRLAEDVKQELRELPGTEEVEIFGNPDEEIVVEVRQADVAALGLSVADVARQLRASDSKMSSGQIRGPVSDLLLGIDAEFDSLARVMATPVHFGNDGRFVPLADLATVRKSIAHPPSSVVLVDGRTAVAVGARVRPRQRIDQWSNEVRLTLSRIEEQLPPGIEMSWIFEQSRYVETRLKVLLLNLLLGTAAVMLVIMITMGWRSALLVGSTLPLSVLLVITGLRLFDISINQMSMTGLIIALGLLIDNAIISVNEVQMRLRAGCSPADAVSTSVRHLAVPLLCSTLTTAMTFAPLALMGGPAGEFVGSVAISVILAIFSSMLLALTVVPALTALAGGMSSNESRSWWRAGYAQPQLTAAYRASLNWLLCRPVWVLSLALALPTLGFFQARHLPEMFFPATDRDQFHIERKNCGSACDSPISSAPTWPRSSRSI